jgi:lipopolysaccharide/colanic/teichoic acid biosynthesis glycosyltransferase
MSASVLVEDAEDRSDDLSDIFDHYVANENLPSPEWLTQLKLQRPRRNVRCLSLSTRIGKRVLDIIGALVLLAILAVPMVLTAIAVRLTSRGPIIFRQTRVGLNQRSRRRDRRNRIFQPLAEGAERRQSECDRRQTCGFGLPFTIYKFRTMRIDAEKDGARFAVANDPRVTPIGGFLRKTRLDEVPQLWNVLRGEMSLVGPRPERPEFIEKLSVEVPNYLHRLGLKPGLTGLAQVINGYDNEIDGFRRKVNLDLLYLQNCCVWNDLKVLLRTVRVVLTGSGAL